MSYRRKRSYKKRSRSRSPYSELTMARKYDLCTSPNRIQRGKQGSPFIVNRGSKMYCNPILNHYKRCQTRLLSPGQKGRMFYNHKGKRMYCDQLKPNFNLIPGIVSRSPLRHGMPLRGGQRAQAMFMASKAKVDAEAQMAVREAIKEVAPAQAAAVQAAAEASPQVANAIVQAAEGASGVLTQLASNLEMNRAFALYLVNTYNYGKNGWIPGLKYLTYALTSTGDLAHIGKDFLNENKDADIQHVTEIYRNFMNSGKIVGADDIIGDQGPEIIKAIQEAEAVAGTGYLGPFE